MSAPKAIRTAQRSLFPEGANVKSTVNGSNSIAKLSNYLKTRDGLWRLLSLFPGDTCVTEAVALAPSALCKTRKGGTNG